MKIGILGPANSVHIEKIVNGLVKRGIDVTLISLPNHKNTDDTILSNIIYLKVSGALGYYLNKKEIDKIIKREQFDLINVHYASGYGTLGRLSKIKLLILSVWGSDIFSFPKECKFKEKIIRKNLSSATAIMSTSRVLAEETKNYLSENKSIYITPFGVDTDKFYPKNKEFSNIITIGFLKGTAEIYGIDIFLEIIDSLLKRKDEFDYEIRIEICGSDVRKDFLMAKVKELNLENIVNFRGMLLSNEMPEIINLCDIVCIPSKEESFGVVALETMACGIPCITSDAPGFKELVKNGETGYIIEGQNVDEYVNKIIELMQDKNLRINMGKNGRKFVKETYSLDMSMEKIILVYSKYIKGGGNKI